MAVSGKNPIFKYYSELVTITLDTNDEFVFTEGGGNLTATLTAGTYYWTELAYEIKRALQAAGAGSYTVTYDHTTRKYTITKSAGTFTLDVGAAGADDALPTLGFTVDCSAALTYTSDTAVPSQTTLTMTTAMACWIKRPQLERESAREDTDLESGRRVSTYHGAVDRYSLRLEFLSVTDIQGLWDMFAKAAAFGYSIDFYPDSADTSNYATVYWDSKSFRPREMTDRGMYELYEAELLFRFKVPAGGTYAARDFLDRGP